MFWINLMQSGMQTQLTNADGCGIDTRIASDWFPLPGLLPELPALLGVTTFGNKHAPVICLQPAKDGSDG